MSNVISLSSFSLGKELETSKKDAQTKLENLISENFIKNDFINEIQNDVKYLKSTIFVSNTKKWFSKSITQELNKYDNYKFIETLKVYLKQTFNVDADIETDGENYFLIIRF